MQSKPLASRVGCNTGRRGWLYVCDT
jgi:hypothetical protein